MLLRRLQDSIEQLIKLEVQRAEISSQRIFYSDSYQNKYYNEYMVSKIDEKYYTLTGQINKLREELFE